MYICSQAVIFRALELADLAGEAIRSESFRDFLCQIEAAQIVPMPNLSAFHSIACSLMFLHCVCACCLFFLRRLPVGLECGNVKCCMFFFNGATRLFWTQLSSRKFVFITVLYLNARSEWLYVKCMCTKWM